MTAPDLRDRLVVVAGLGVSGAASARVLADLGARVVAVDGREGEAERGTAAELDRLGVQVRLGDAESWVDGAELVVTSPGWRPDQPLLARAQRCGVPVWGEPELAFRLRPHAPPWLGVTGTNGKTTTVGMLESILRAAGLRTVAAGNVGRPLVEAVLAEPAHDVLAVELSSFQLHWSPSLRCCGAVILNLADDHTDWHGSFEAYAADKARIWGTPAEPVPGVLYNHDDEATRRLAAAFPQARSFTLGDPGPGRLGVADGSLIDGDGTVLAAVDDVRLPGAHNVANALAAAGLARGLERAGRPAVPAEAVREGLRAFGPGRHRNELVATVDGVAYVDDSKATNPHAAAASLAAYPSVVWVAGGLLKGASVDALVAEHAARLRAVVLLGRDRARIAAALARHAPAIPVVDLPSTDTEVMATAVDQAAGLAMPGDTVLLAPAAASMDIFRDYAARGDAFAAAARRREAGRA